MMIVMMGFAIALPILRATYLEDALVSQKVDLEAQYRSMEYNELTQLRRDAVLSEEACEILQLVLAEKQKHHFTGDTLRKIRDAKQSRNFSDLSPAEIEWVSEQIVLTTESTPIDLRIARRIEILSAECVYGMNIFRDTLSAVRDVIGGRSVASEKVLRDARKTCLSELKREALMVGADAVVGIRLDYSELSGGGKSQMLMIVATGTAVTLLSPRA